MSPPPSQRDPHHTKVQTVYPLRRDAADNPTPFPTIYWLSDPALDREIADLERRGTVGQIEAMIRQDHDLLQSFHDDHVRYRAARWAMLTPDDRALVEASPSLLRTFQGGIGGIADFTTVKCLHAHIAHHLADHNTAAAMLLDGRIDAPEGLPAALQDLR